VSASSPPPGSESALAVSPLLESAEMVSASVGQDIQSNYFGAQGFDTERRFVHITKRHENGLVQFEFSVGTPDFSVELMLPQPAFDEFCTRQNAVFVHDEVKQPWEESNDD
jgi:phenol/toluene 2-monooxygenase (NADH) P0/A0